MSKVLRKYLEDLGATAIGASAVGGFETIATKTKPLKTVYPEQTDMSQTKNIAIDVDGTLHKYSKGWHDGTLYDDPFEGAKEALEKLKDMGFRIIIYTTRLSNHSGNDVEKQKEYLVNWLDKHQIPYDEMTSDKIPAEHYVDDRGVRFDGDWNEIVGQISELEEK